MTTGYLSGAVAGASFLARGSDTGRFARRAVIGLTALLIVLLVAGSGLILWHRYLDPIPNALCRPWPAG
jgi:hypothetical protein